MSKGIEMNFLESWESWDQLDTCSMIFTNVVLKAVLANRLNRSTDAQWFTVDTESSFVQIGYGEGDYYEFELDASLGAQL